MATDPRSPDPDRADAPDPTGDEQAEAPATPEPLRELTFGGRRPSPVERSIPAIGPTLPDLDLDAIASRCRMKAEAARLAADRLRRPLDPPIEGEATDPALAAWADRLFDCACWLEANDDASTPGGVSLLDDVGGLYEAVAEALALLATAGGGRGQVEKALPLLAEAQSALRAALARLRAPEDPDQLAAYERVRQDAARHRVFLKRFMRADDLADPSRWPDLLARIAAISGGDEPSRQRRSRLDWLRRHLEAIRQGRGDVGDWRLVAGLVEALIDSGVPPSDREIRGLLLPVIEDLPDEVEVPPGLRRVLQEIDRFLATEATPSASAAAPEPTAEVKEVARLLGGRSVVLIGGDRRREAQEALVSAFGLDELVWIETKEHQAVSSFEPAIARPEVVLVLLAIRWSSHAFGDVKHSCDRLGTLLVRLPGGYSPNQVATQILSQCGDRLREFPR